MVATPDGEVLLIDCHSMPPRPRGEANIVIGDRHGCSAAPWLVEAAEDENAGQAAAVGGTTDKLFANAILKPLGTRPAFPGKRPCTAAARHR